jgi:hypothetical protein
MTERVGGSSGHDESPRFAGGTVERALAEQGHLPDAEQAEREYKETRQRVIEGRASRAEAQGFIEFLEEAIP